MPQAIRVCDVVQGDVLELGPQVPVLRGSYDLFRPAGPVTLHDGIAEWREGGGYRTCRTAPTVLGDVHPGERVLMHSEPDDSWHLVEVQAVEVDGVWST